MTEEEVIEKNKQMILDVHGIVTGKFCNKLYIIHTDNFEYVTNSYKCAEILIDKFKENNIKAYKEEQSGLYLQSIHKGGVND